MTEAAVETLAWRADPLIWGRGPRTFEAFLEPTCPYSAKAFPSSPSCSRRPARTG